WLQPSSWRLRGSCRGILIFMSGLPSIQGLSAGQRGYPGPGTATQRNDGLGGRCGSQAGRAPNTPDCGIAGRCDEPVSNMPTCRQAGAQHVREAFAVVRLDPPSKALGSSSLGLSITPIPTSYHTRINLS